MRIPPILSEFSVVTSYGANLSNKLSLINLKQCDVAQNMEQIEPNEHSGRLFTEAYQHNEEV
jgi:hypothetical protein